MGLIMWLFCGLMHIFFAPVYAEFANTLWTLTPVEAVAEAEVVEAADFVADEVEDEVEADEDSDDAF